MTQLTKNAHRPARINDFVVDLIVKARHGGLTIAETAAFLKVSERTLYRWIEQGRDLWIAIELHWSKERDKLSLRERDKLRLYEALFRREEDLDYQGIMRALEERIMEKELEIQDREDDRKERRQKKKERTAKQREIDKQRKRKARADEKFKKILAGG